MGEIRGVSYVKWQLGGIVKKVFLSWSGESSRAAAQALYDWLPVIIQNVKPFMSSEDLRKGGRWNTELSNELQETSFGIICLTKTNTIAPWVIFEAGALSKIVDDSHVAPLLIGIKPSDLPQPLTQFNAASIEKADFLKLLKNVNAASGDDAIGEGVLLRSFEAAWPSLSNLLEKAIEKVPEQSPAGRAENSSEQLNNILQEILVLSRSNAKLLNSPDNILPLDYMNHVLLRARDREGRGDIVESDHRVWRDLKEGRYLLSEILGRIPSAHIQLVMSRAVEEISKPIDYLLSRNGSSQRSDASALQAARKTADAIFKTVDGLSQIDSDGHITREIAERHAAVLSRSGRRDDDL